MIHEDAIISSELLPDYALKNVNIREGWQILSDIGHIHGITWEGQNKLYSASHALTRCLCSNAQSFEEFINHYDFNLFEYERRFKSKTIWHEKFVCFLGNDIYKKIQAKISHNKYQNTIRYLLEEKKDKLTSDEVARLVGQL